MNGVIIREIILYIWFGVTIIIGVVLLSLITGYIGAKKGGHDTVEVKKYLTIFTPIFIIFLFAAVMLTIGISTYKEWKACQQAGMEYEEAGDYYMAYWSYRELREDVGGPWSDLDECIARVREPGLYATAGVFEDAQEWIDAITIYQQIPNYADSQERIDVCMYRYLLERHPDWILGGKSNE